MATKSKNNLSGHPVDHMKYMVLLHELNQEGNEELRDKFLEMVEKNSQTRRDRRIPTLSLFADIANSYNDFIRENPSAEMLVSEISLENDPLVLLQASGIDPEQVSPQFINDLTHIYRYQERMGSKSDNFMDPRQFIVENKDEILRLSSISKNRDMFKGLTFGLIHNKNKPKLTRLNEKGTIVTDFHGFDFNTREMLKNNRIKEIIAETENALTKRREAFIQESKAKREAKDFLNGVGINKEKLIDNIADAGHEHLKQAVPGPHVADYMKYLLMLNEITKDDNAALFDKYVQGLLAERAYEDASKITVDQLVELDFSENLIAERLETISSQTPEIREAVENYILKFNSESVLEQAGYDNSKLPDHFKSDVRTIMAYEASFPVDNKPTLSSRLSGVKDAVMDVLAKDHTRMALSGTMFAVACAAAGPFAIALSGASMAKTFLENEKVVNLLNKGQEKLNNALVKLGVKKEVITEKENLIGSKLKSFFENKYVKSTMMVASVAALTFGVATVTAPYIADGTISNIASTVGNAIADGASSAADLASEGASSVSDYVANIDTSGIEKTVSDMGDNIAQTYDEAKDYIAGVDTSGVEKTIEGAKDFVAGIDTSGVEKTIDEAKNYVTSIDTSGVEKTSESIGSWFGDKFDKLTELAGFASDEMTDLEAESESVASQNADYGTSELKQTITIKEDDRLLNIARDLLEQEFGVPATQQQMAMLVNDLGLADPNNIQIDQKIDFPKDLSVYKDVTKIPEMDWLKEALPIDKGHFDLAADYDIEQIMKGVGTNSSLAEIAKMNQGIDIHNLSPGDTIQLNTESGMIEHTVPDIDDSIMTAVFPDGAPEFLNKDKFVEMIKDANPDIDLSSGLFGNGDLGRDILLNDKLNIPQINLAELQPVNKTFLLDATNYHATKDVNNTLLSVAFPNGVPPLVDEKLVLDSIKNNNPGLESLIKSSKGFEEIVTIGDKPAQAVAESVSKAGSETVAKTTLFEKGNSESFMDRVRGKNNEADFSV